MTKKMTVVFHDEELYKRLKIAAIEKNIPVLIKKLRARKDLHDDSDWIVMKKYLELYESKIMGASDMHGIEMPDREDDDGL